MKVRAAVLRQMGLPAPYAQSRPLVIDTIELAAPGAGELCVKVLAAGLCHSDLSVIDGSRPRVMPMVMGHEAVGEIVEVGADVQDFAVGDRVVFSFVPGCGHCLPCAGGRPALCEPGAKANTNGTLLSGERRWQQQGSDLNHHLGVSAFAEHTVVSARSAVKIDPEVPPQIAALFGCAVMTGVGAVVNTARVAPGESVAVFGLGGVGLAALIGARAAGAYPLVAVDVLPQKLALAAELGATHCVLAEPGADVVAQVREATHGGALHAIETVGSEAVLAQAYAATRRGGTTVTVGLPHPSRQFSISAVSLVAEERTVKGSYMGSCVPARDIPRFVGLYRAGRLPVDRLLTHEIALDELNEAFDRLASGAAVRQVIRFG
ncbi:MULTISPECIES: zinc-dependent alcohol dehydrogenase family protein [Hydrocarboniphaga]|jgi:Zn-dependent alcohol dehydrogenase|uniref:Putative zinc-type alcohol dehydrogenase transmembrane protein n=1 Tax=Hydrocarboniphaga effusa AP103 TaxID=1172194 RepID=I8TBW0_9GAMM|nr:MULTISPECIES: zinc-dependent alcohol dehydrogenase family protein [Hydrocarboniphaga]EIT71068.1 putative zinc-type alcohol dehydrogenase transmembrane protein [Hydrocarboniphaga effusa AP103]MDZ4079570.1 zinc-dependent alcohol dehydrogenase family protein [Hydrocarboniphaga sp.]